MGINYKYRGISGRGRLLFLKFTYSGGTLQASNNRTTTASPLQSALLCMRYLTMITVTCNPVSHFWQSSCIYRLMWSQAIIIFISCILRGSATASGSLLPRLTPGTVANTSLRSAMLPWFPVICSLMFG